MLTGNKHNSILNIHAKQALYRKDGKWYHHLKKFPGVLFDRNGFICFNSKAEYENNRDFQHGRSLHTSDGISKITGYRYFNEQEKKRIASIAMKRELLNDEFLWPIFLKCAEEYKRNEEVFVSSSEHRRYMVTNIKKDVVKITRLDAENTFEKIGKDKFKTCIKRINNNEFPINKGSIYDHAVEEATIVELLPMLDWNEDGNKIVLVSNAFYDEKFNAISETKNDDLGKKDACIIANSTRAKKT